MKLLSTCSAIPLASSTIYATALPVSPTSNSVAAVQKSQVAASCSFDMYGFKIALGMSHYIKLDESDS